MFKHETVEYQMGRPLGSCFSGTVTGNSGLSAMLIRYTHELEAQGCIETAVFRKCCIIGRDILTERIGLL